MRRQEDRDSMTLNIAMSLLIFVAGSAVGALLLFLVSTLGVDAPLDVFGDIVFAAAAAAALFYLWRHRRP